MPCASTATPSAALVPVVFSTGHGGEADDAAETVTNGDPTWAGSLAGVALNLPVFHIMEPEIKAQIAPEVYEEHLALMDIALDVDKITEGLKRVRERDRS